MKTLSLDFSFGFETPSLTRRWFADAQYDLLHSNGFFDEVPGWEFMWRAQLLGVNIGISIAWL